MFGYISNRESPGAGDNLIGCAIGIKLAEIFKILIMYFRTLEL